MTEMKILITGVAGFIGRSLAENLLTLNHQIVGIDNLVFGNLENVPRHTNFSFHKSDIRDQDSLRFYEGVDVVIHLAGISSLPECQNNPAEAYSVNLSGTAQVLELSRLAGVSRVVFASTSAVYENNSEQFFKEEDRICPDLVYSHSKACAEELARNFSSNYGLPVSVIRFFNVYGPHQNFSRKSPPLLGYITRCIINKEQPTFFSDGNQKRDYIFVDDLIQLIRKVMTESKDNFEVINACTEEVASVKDIFKIVKSLYPESIDPIYSPSEHFWESYENLHTEPYALRTDRISREVNKYSRGTYQLAKEKYGWQPQVSLSEGVSLVISQAFNNTTKFIIIEKEI
jgi:UDP-glucose 4-epimerase